MADRRLDGAIAHTGKGEFVPDVSESVKFAVGASPLCPELAVGLRRSVRGDRGGAPGKCDGLSHHLAVVVQL